MAQICMKLVVIALLASTLLFMLTAAHPAPDPRADPGYYGNTWYYGYYNHYKNTYHYKNGNYHGSKYGSYYGYY